MWKKKVAVLFMAVMCFLFPVVEVIGAEIGTGKGKYIHIVFDNSVSMIMDGVKGAEGKTEQADSLADATYALQVLLGMLEEGDTAVIYPISIYDKNGRDETIQNVTINHQIANDSEKLQNQIKKMVSPMAENTYFEAVEEALDDLSEKKDNREKWLVVLTDGDYENTGWGNVADEVDERLKQTDNVNIIHYSFGTKSKNGYGELDSTDNVTYYTNTDDMLDTMIRIANQIFGRQEIEIKSVGNGEYSFILDTPVSKLLLFAQDTQGGSDLQISFANFKEMGKNSLTIETIENFEDVKILKDYQKGIGYEGNITTYDFGAENTEENSDLLPTGEYKVKVKGGDNPTVRLYCEPVVEVGLVFEEVESGEKYIFSDAEAESKIPGGEYKIYLELFDPLKTNAEKKKYKSLSRDSWIYQQMEYYGTIETLDGEESINEVFQIWQGELERGTYQVSATADIFRGLSKNVEIEIEVMDSLKDIVAELLVPEEGINIERLAAEKARRNAKKGKR